jgi:hypothetical protein
VKFLRGPAEVTLNGSGEFGNLRVDRLDVNRGRTRLGFVGTVSNLHRPGDLTLAVTMRESPFWPGDPRELMPSFDLPDYTPMGMATLSAQFSGRPLDFLARLHLTTEGGSVETSDVHLVIGGPHTLRYDGTASVRNLDFARLLGDARLSSRVNANVEAHGAGVDLENLTGTIDVRIDTSGFRGLFLDRTSLSINATPQSLTAAAQVALGTATASMRGEIERRIDGSPRYTADLRADGVNLAALLRDEELDSDLRLRARVEGHGTTWGTLGGEALLDLSSSRYRTFTWDSGAVRVSLDQRDPRHRMLDLRSSVADVSLRGAFDLAHAGELILYETMNIRNALGERLASFDSSLTRSLDRQDFLALERRLASRTDHLDVEFSIDVKNLDPVSALISDKTFGGEGWVRGVLQGSAASVTLHGDASVREFFIGTADGGMLLQNATASIAVDSLPPHMSLDDLRLRCTARAEKMHINYDAFDSVDVLIDQRTGRSRWAGAMRLNDNLRLRVDAAGQVLRDSVRMVVNVLEAAYHDFDWRADPGARLDLTGTGLQVAHLVVRNDSQRVVVDGSLRSGGVLAVSVDGDHLALDDLRYLLSAEELGPEGQAFAGSARIRGSVGGTIENTTFDATIRAEDISFRSIPFGHLEGRLRHAAGRLDVNLETRNGDPGARTPDLVIAGNVPVDLSFGGVANRISDAPLDLHITSRGIQMNILDPLLPTFNDLRGTLRCDVDVRGTLRHPDYHGRMEISGCTFLFTPNNIGYALDGEFEPEGERIVVRRATVRNLPGDNLPGRTGEASIGGDFALRGLLPEDFNLTVTGRLLVVKETSRISALSVYGNLFLDIGPGGLHFTGAIDNSLLKGSILVTNSTLVFPPTREVTTTDAILSVPVVMVDDTAHHHVEPAHSAVTRYFTRNGGNGTKDRGAPETNARSFTDGLHYDLDIEATGGTAEIRMIFNPTTGEELDAAINGNFLITDDGRRWFGDLVVERASYFFLKRFNAEGRIRFTGDFLNPVLDITAQYTATRTVGDSASERVVVTFKISGTRNEPRVAYAMTINDVDYALYKGVKSNDLQSDAIAFIVSGAFPLSAAQKNDAAADLSVTARHSLFTGAASLLTGTLSELLRDQTGFINSVEFSYGGGRGLRDAADVRLSGTAWKGYWRYGGKILDDPLANANVSLLYSVGTIFDAATLRNLMVELERKVEAGAAGQTANDIKRVNSARLFYRFSF